ncbi:MAG TPA: S9 family peptidase [Terriglobales bacterium]|nr:S9 family peptidase [Terriglobales bacterium]
MSERKLFLQLIALTIAGLPFIAKSAAQQTAPANRISIEQLIDIRHPSDPVWSPDGKHVAFIWDRANVKNLYLANSDGQGKPVALTFYSDEGAADPFWSHDGRSIYYSHGGGLWQVTTGDQPHAAWSSSAVESDFALSHDGTRIAFVRHVGKPESQQGGDLVVRALADGTESRLVHDELSIEGPVWSPDDAHLAYIAGSKIIHHDESPSYAGEKLIFVNLEYVPGQLFAVPASGGKPTKISTPGEYNGLAWVDSGRVTYDRQSNAYKTRTIYVCDINGGTPKAVHEDNEDKFWSLPDWEANAKPNPSPDGKWIAFLTDLDGWDHLYVVASSGGKAIQITKGQFEAWRPAWSHDSTRIAFDANEPGKPGDRRIGIATIGGDPTRTSVVYVTPDRGTNIEPHWSADDKRLLYQHTDTHNSADLFVIDAASGSKPVRLSDSMPAAIDRSAFVEPEAVHYPGPDGQSVPAWLFVPKNLDRTKKHPAIVWIHGDGINQNYNGWHVQRNYAVYYSFHQYLLQQGYVVIAPDYRGSIGYGRDWRNGVYMDVGGKDAKDAWMAANYLKTIPYVDGERIGVWGLSYGGFFTLISMTDQPTLFRAGVDVAGVVDYVMYYNDPYHGDWTEGRIGTPEQNPQVYANASPLSHIDRLARPLLVLHGTSDINVPFLESVRLIDEALKKNKGPLTSFMIYPGEFHYFSREHVLRDAWRRVDDFFALQLRGEAREHDADQAGASPKR